LVLNGEYKVLKEKKRENLVFFRKKY